MTVLRLLAVVFLFAALGCLSLAAIEYSERNSDRLAVAQVEEATGQLTDPGEPVFAEKFLLLWAFRLGSGLVACLSVLLVAKMCQGKKTREEKSLVGEIPATHVWWGKGA